MPFLELEGKPDLENNPRELVGEVVVGSGSQATWRLSGSDLAARHFRIALNNGTAQVIPASPQNVVVLNGEQVPTDGAPLNTGDIVAAGQARFVFLTDLKAKRPRPVTEMPDAHLIDVTNKKGYTLRRRVVQIGREIGCSIVLKDPTISRFHADVRAEGGQFVLYAMGSSGTKVNGEPAVVPRLLREGDQIAMGDTTFTFSSLAMPPGIRAVQFEDHEDDSFSRKNTQLAQRAVTSEHGKYARGQKKQLPLIPIIIGIGVVVILLVLYLVFRR
ncbi:MAG: domain containing protein [Gemmatimonadetes bacterium]|nr:domain containing protein [Gemmatimonadota bacterium]